MSEIKLFFYSKYSPTCQRIFNQLDYIKKNMDNVVLYDVDCPKTRQIMLSYGVVSKVPSAILINQNTGAITIYEDNNCQDLITKAVQVINTQKTTQMERKAPANGTPISSIGIPQDDNPRTSLNTRIQPSDIIESREPMAISTTLPPVEHQQTSAISNSQMIDDVDPNMIVSNKPQKPEGMSMDEIIGNQEANISRAAMEKSRSLKSATDAMTSERGMIDEYENKMRRPQPLE